MHACFYGGGSGSGSKATKSVAIIRDLTKTMKAITLKLKGGDGARAWRQRSTAEDEDQQLQGMDASSSAKIAPHAEEHRGEKHCHRCCSPLEDGHTAEEEEQGTAPADEAASSDGDWMAEPEPGLLMTLSPLGDGANYLRRIRFSEEHFPDAQAARAWWEENFDRIAELYSIVVQYEHVEDDDEDDPAAPATPCHSEDDEHQRPGDGEYLASCSASGSASGSTNKVDSPILGLVIEPNSSKRSKQAQNNQKTGPRTVTLSED